jgi:hypothetical protein
MCGFFNSNKNRMASTAINRRGRTRSIKGQNRRLVTNMMYDNARAADSNNRALSTVTYIEQPTKKQQEALDLGFLGYSLKYGDIAIILDPSDILPYTIQENEHIIGNGVFDGIRCDKIAITYSPKKKMFYYLALNDNYQCHIIFKSNNIHELPNIGNIDMDILPVNSQIIGNFNRLINSVYEVVTDLTYNPIIYYKVRELFKI